MVYVNQLSRFSKVMTSVQPNNIGTQMPFLMNTLELFDHLLPPKISTEIFDIQLKRKGIEDTEHFLLLCPSFDLQRRDLLAGIVELLRPFVQITNLSNDALIQLLLYGDQYLSYDLNRNIIALTLRFIHETGRFD